MRVKPFIYTFFILSVLAAPLFSQNLSRLEYIQKYQVLAIKEMTRSGVPASITMAQACLESADGNSRLAKLSNNHFGIKCKTNWNGEAVYYDDDERNECFRSYKTVEESYFDHTNFLMDNFRYAFLFNFPQTDYKSWARGLKKAGYATAPSYDRQLIEIIETFQLHQLDTKRNESELANFEQLKIGARVHNGMLINPYHTREPQLVNGLKAVVAKQGDTFEIIAQEFGLNAWELYRFNDYPQGYVPQPNEIIYIQAKKRKAPKGTGPHVVGEGETMHYISQFYGVKLKPLCLRNKMRTGDQPVAGQSIRLGKKTGN